MRVFWSLLMLAAFDVRAQTAVYTWEDAEGVTHYTDDQTKVPSGAKSRTTVGADVTVTGPAPVVAKPAATAVVAAPGADDKADDDAKRASVWRRRFADARNEVRRLEDEVEIERKATEEVAGMPVNNQYNCVNFYGARGPRAPVGCFAGPNPEWQRRREQLERNRRALERARSDLSDLEREVANEGIPLEWRRGVP